MATATIAVLVLLPSCSRAPHVVDGGFWFDHVTLDLAPADVERLGGMIRPDEAKRIESIAHDELNLAYAGLRIRFVNNPSAFYRVSVVQDIVGRTLPAAGQSRRFLPFGGMGGVSFRTLAGHAIAHAPAGADRAMIVNAIGRGIGRTAAHEFAHQILPRVNLHESKDVGSYEYTSADRAEQYYGEMHWDFARPMLLERLGK